jgi:large subunit ribosomal protein L15
MMIHDVTALAGPYKNRKRVGRGEGSGHGKQSGRGNKGAGSRSGNAAKKAFEGGQMPYFRRLPKFGFTNAPFKVKFWTVNLGDIVSHPAFKGGGTVSAESLIKAGLVRDESRDLKILGSLGKAKSLGVKLQVDVSRVSDSAKKMITDAGGSVKETGTRRDRTRGIDRMSEDRKPKNLTKKLKRSSTKPKKIEAEAEEAPAAEAPKKG